MPNPVLLRTVPVYTLALTFAATAALPVGAWEKDRGPASPQFQGNPSVTSHWPRGGQRGTTVEIAFTGIRLDDPRGLVCLTTDNTPRPIPCRLHPGSFLRPDGVYPSGGNPGTALTVELQGLPDGENAAAMIKLPDAGA